MPGRLKRTLSVEPLGSDKHKKPRKGRGKKTAGASATLTQTQTVSQSNAADPIGTESYSSDDDYMRAAESLRYHAEIQALKTEVSRQSEVIKQLQAQVGFLLSYVGIKDDEFPPLVSSASATSSGAQPSTSSAVHTNLPPMTDTTARLSFADSVRQPSKLSVPLKHAVLTAVHTELQSKHGRDANIVVTGLTQQDGVDGKNVLSTFLEHELDLKPTVVHCKRLGRTTTQNSRPRPLLAVLDSSFNARLVLSAAKRLQDSDDPYMSEVASSSIQT